MYYYPAILWALAISLSTFAGIWTFFAYRRRAYPSVLRGAALILLPWAALFTRTLTLLMKFVDATVLWAVGFAFRPSVWLGLILFVISVALFAVAGRLGGRRPTRSPTKPQVTAGKDRPATPADEDLAEIEAILKNRGIT